VRVVDVSDPVAPTEVGFYGLPENVEGVALANGYAYVGGGTAGLYILRYGSSVTGRVADVNGAPFSAVTVSAGSGLDTVTDANGIYTITNLSSGTYSLTPSLPGYAFLPGVRTVTVPPDANAQNFTILPGPVSVTLLPFTAARLIYTDTQDLPTQLIFPANTVTQSTTITLTPTLAFGGPGLTFAGHAFDIVSSHPGFFFQAPVTATIHYSDADVQAATDENELMLHWWDGSAWVDAATTCVPISTYSRDLTNNVIGVSICYLNRYALLGPTNQVLLPLVLRKTGS
jgi:hypothetical protein